jgi:hypothetical protein
MEIRVVDRARNVTVVPTKDPDKNNLAATLDTLMQGQNLHGGQIEFECDAAFLAALEAQKPSGLDDEDEIDTLHGKRRYIYKGVPIVLIPEPEGT